jgi:hypothetical protein
MIDWMPPCSFFTYDGDFNFTLRVFFQLAACRLRSRASGLWARSAVPLGMGVRA